MTKTWSTTKLSRLTGVIIGIIIATFTVQLIAGEKADKVNPAQQESQAKPPLQLTWQVNAATQDVFDQHVAPYFNLLLEIDPEGGLLNKEAILNWQLTDYFDAKIAAGQLSSALTQAKNPLQIDLPAQSRLGIYRLTLTAEVDDVTDNAPLLQFAVIPPRQIIPDRFSPNSPYNLSNSRELALFARLGMKKYRGPYWGVDKVEKTLEELAGLGMLWSGTYVAFGKADDPATLAQKSAKIADDFIKLAERQPQRLYFIELYNEPENWPPTKAITDLWPFALQIADCFSRLHQAIPQVKLINPGVTHRNLDYLRKTALAGLDDPRRLPDIVAVHGYRSPSPPEFAHEDDIAALRDLFPDRPIWNNEDAVFVEGSASDDLQATITRPSATILETDELTQAAYLPRQFLVQLAAGYAMVTQFDGIVNHSVSRNPHYRRPALGTLAGLTWVLPQPQLQRRLTANMDNLWALSWKNIASETTNTEVNTRENAAADTDTTDWEWLSLWTLNYPEKLSVSGDNVTIFDAFANPLELSTGNTLVVGGMPYYVRGQNLSLTRQGQTSDLPAYPLPAEKPQDYHGLTIKSGGCTTVTGTPQVWIEVTNISGEKLESVQIRPHFMNRAPADWNFTPAMTEFSLDQDEIKRLFFTPQGESFNPLDPQPEVGYAALWWTEGYRIAVELTVKSATTIVKQTTPMSLRGIPYLAQADIDADASEWTNVPLFKQMGGKRRNTQLSKFWTGYTDFCPTFKLAWNEQGLLLWVEISDDKHDVSQTGLKAWRTDSVQISVIPEREKVSFTNYPVLTLATSGKPILQREFGTYQPGEIDVVTLATKRINGNYSQTGVTYYESLIPWSFIGKTNVKAGDVIGASLLFNESDGYWRKGWEGYFPQMGGHIIDPRFFADLTLLQHTVTELAQ